MKRETLRRSGILATAGLLLTANIGIVTPEVTQAAAVDSAVTAEVHNSDSDRIHYTDANGYS